MKAREIIWMKMALTFSILAQVPGHMVQPDASLSELGENTLLAQYNTGSGYGSPLPSSNPGNCGTGTSDPRYISPIPCNYGDQGTPSDTQPLKPETNPSLDYAGKQMVEFPQPEATTMHIKPNSSINPTVQPYGVVDTTGWQQESQEEESKGK